MSGKQKTYFAFNDKTIYVALFQGQGIDLRHRVLVYTKYN